MSTPSNPNGTNLRRYALEFFPGVFTYLVLLLTSSSWVGSESPRWWIVTVALLPMIPVAWMLVATVRHIRRSDEYQSRLALLASSYGFAASMIIAISIALLRGGGIDVASPEWVIFGGGMAAWGVGVAWAGTR